MNSGTFSPSNSKANQSKSEIMKEIKSYSRVSTIRREAAAHLNKYRRNNTISSSINDSSPSILALQKTNVKNVTPMRKNKEEGEKRIFSQTTIDRKRGNRPAINVKVGTNCKPF